MKIIPYYFVIHYLCFVRKISAIFFSILFISTFIMKVGILTAWVVQYDYIVKNICIQKEKKINTCHGSCHLNDQLKLVDSPDDNDQIPKKNFIQKLEVEFLVSNFTCCLMPMNEMTPKIVSNYLESMDQYESINDIPPPKFG